MKHPFGGKSQSLEDGYEEDRLLVHGPAEEAGLLPERDSKAMRVQMGDGATDNPQMR